MKQALIILGITFVSTAAWGQTDSSQIQVISDNDTIRFIVNGEESTIANTDMANYYLTQGLEAAGTGDYRSAEDKFRVALLYDLDNPEILYNLGLAQFYNEEYEDAIGSLDYAAEYDPENKNIYNQRGLCKAYLGNYTDAETDFKIMLKYDPYFAMGNYNYGVLMLQVGDYSSACEYLQKADELGYANAVQVLSSYCNE